MGPADVVAIGALNAARRNALVALAGLLRLPGLGYHQLHTDETVVLLHARQALEGEDGAFAGMKPGDASPRRRRPGHMETLMRVTEVQGHGINAIRSGSVDLLVEPETSPFEFADFTKAAPLAEAGHEAMAKAIPQIEQMIRDLRQWPA